MNTYVAFLRGINVGGNTMVSMKDLAAICTDMGLEGVRTYLNSGNIIFRSPRPEVELQRALEKEFSERIGKESTVAVRSSGDLKEIVEKNLSRKRSPPGSACSSVLIRCRKKSWQDLPRRAGRGSCGGNGKCISTTRTGWVARN